MNLTVPTTSELPCMPQMTKNNKNQHVYTINGLP